MDLGQVAQANADRVLRDTGIDISGARREIDTSAINHALKQHGSDTTEAKRGQAAITPEDFGKIPEIVERPDNVERIGQNRIGRSEEHTSELQSLMRISYAVFCLKKKKTQS